MKKINRAELRGKPLDSDCKKAHTSTHEYGKDDNRGFCLGIKDLMTEEPLEKCEVCKAFVFNAEPLEEESK